MKKFGTVLLCGLWPIVANAQVPVSSVSSGAPSTSAVSVAPGLAPGAMTPATMMQDMAAQALNPAPMIARMRAMAQASGALAPGQPSQLDVELDKIYRGADSAYNQKMILTKENCSGNGAMSFLSSSPTKESLARAICRLYNSGKPEDITDYACHSTANGFYKCFVSRVGVQDLNFELRYTNGLWKVYDVSAVGQ